MSAIEQMILAKQGLLYPRKEKSKLDEFFEKLTPLLSPDSEFYKALATQFAAIGEGLQRRALSRLPAGDVKATGLTALIPREVANIVSSKLAQAYLDTYAKGLGMYGDVAMGLERLKTQKELAEKQLEIQREIAFLEMLGKTTGGMSSLLGKILGEKLLGGV